MGHVQPTNGLFDKLEGLREIRAGLHRVRMRWRAFDLAAGGLMVASVLMGLVLALGLAQMMIRMPASWRIGLMWVSVLGVGGLVWLWLVRPARERITDERAAVKVESAFPSLRNALINAIQLARAKDLPAPMLAAAAIEQAAGQMKELPIEKAIGTKPLRRATITAGAVLLALVLVIRLNGAAFGTALRQLVQPNTFVPSVGDHPIVNVTPGDARVLAGGSLNVGVEISPYDGPAPEATLFVREDGADRETTLKMEMAERTRFMAYLQDLRKPLRYRVEVGTSQSTRYRVEIIERPRVERIEALVTPPAYTRLKPEAFKDGSGDLKAPQDSKADVKIWMDRAVAQAALRMDGNDVVPLQVNGGGKELSGQFDVKRNGCYTVRVTDRDGNATTDDTPRKIECVPDRPPAVKIVQPAAHELTVAAGAKVPVRVEAADDYGLTEVSVRFRRNREGVEQNLRLWDKLEPGRPAREGADFALSSAAGFEAGDTVYYWAEAKDRSQMARTEQKIIKLIDPMKAKEEKIEALGDILKRLEMVLQWQNTALTQTDRHRDVVLQQKKPIPVPEVSKVLDTQQKVRGECADVNTGLRPDDTSLAWIRQALTELLSDAMPRAILAAERVKQRVAKPGELEDHLNDLSTQQRLIVAGLKSILAVLPKTAEEIKDEVDPKWGGDLPNDVKDKLENLKDKMKEFADEQRKVVKANEDLAKTPVEDLTEEQKKELEKLKAIEDKWEKFLKEAYTDLSKIPKQDFSDPRLLQELVQTYEEVEMAKDCLSKKAQEIACALEECGAENAESITTNLEKWLPDKADREKWTMEEPVGDLNPPMPELPHELEDLVGDLVEQEEDLMEEADDATSKWADSPDKGAGWDAMDGPISSMSAKGVTGNQLPNTSEIGGRAGEGRTGKSSGEMVSDTAVGKGGRRTPTRLTPDPFEAGQIKDTSKDSAGGSTGGGKMGGAGGEGLEGPTPPDQKLLNERLAGRQADLRNKAERLALNLKLMNYPSADLEKAIKEMKQVESALKDGRYTNIARQREVLLKDLKGAQRHATGVARIARDGAPNLPRSVQDEVLDALSGENAPKGYEDLLKGYYDSLIQGDEPHR
jgi:hypothetical protein